MIFRRILFSAALLPAALLGQMLNPAALLKPPADTWPTYNGDYSGRRHSPLSQINASNIGSLALAWMYRTDVGAERGVGTAQIKSTPLEVNGILYFT
ncbi:MAG: acido-empty-quinoprotein group A, partial [Bryobacteraceae bacterium]